MNVTFNGYKYIKTSAGYLKVLFLTCDDSYRNVGPYNQNLFTQAFNDVTYVEGSTAFMKYYNRNTNTVVTLGATNIEIGPFKTYWGRNNNSVEMKTTESNDSITIGSVGGYPNEDYRGFAFIAVVYYAKDDAYIMCLSGSSYTGSSGYVEPSNNKWGFVSLDKNSSAGWGVGLFDNYWFYNKDFDAFIHTTPLVDTLPNDPYMKGDSSSSNGGGGTFGGGNTIFGGASDSIDIPPLPTASASAAGFITLFNPTLGQLNNLASYMWSDLFSLDTFKKIFSDPMDCILGLSIVPVKPASAGTSAVKIGNVSTDVAMNKTSSQYVAVDCGTIDVKEYWGAYLDYAPYTQCEIYLPYVGTKQISVDDVMNKAVHVVYHVDILSGACNAYVKCGDSVLYTFVGQCSSSIPISGNDWTNVLNGAISVAGKIGLAMATGGATALMSGLGAASSIISSSKPTVERSGAMSSTGGLLGIQKPYLILTRPKQALPENQNKYTGYPSFITMALSECTGYTEIDSVHLENMTCTDEEAQEIENLLKSGVIF